MEDTMLELLEVCRQKEFYCMHNEVKHTVEQPTKRGTRIFESSQNFRVIHKKSSISLNNSSQISLVNAITPVLPTKEPEYSLSMGYEHLSTTLETESDEVIKSSVKNLVPILSEYEVTSDNESECDVPVYKDSFNYLEDHSEILSNSNNDDISSDDDAFEDIEYVEASLLDLKLVSLEEENDVYQEEKEFDLEDILQIQDVILCKKLLGINRLIADFEFLNDNPTPDCVLKSSVSFLIFEKSDNSLSYSDNSLPEFETFNDHTEETSSEEVDLFLASDNSIPPGIENFGYDSKGDIYFLEELLVNDSISLPENELSYFDHHDDPSFPRPPSKPPDVEFFFDLEPNSEEVISDELIEDECFDPGGEINVFENVKDDDYFPFIFVIRNFLPYLIYLEDYTSAITPNEPVLSIEEPDNSLSMGDEHLDTISATESNEFINTSVENLIPIPSESEGIPDHRCDVPSHDNSPPLDVLKDQFEDFSESNEEFSSTDDDSFSFDKIDYVEASPPNSELVSSEVMEIVILDDQSRSNEDVLEKIVSKPLSEEQIIPMKLDQHPDNAESDLMESLHTHDSSLLISSKIDSLLDEFADEL
nr:hypothetical protein [Tanacetum cinerariifolium]